MAIRPRMMALELAPRRLVLLLAAGMALSVLSFFFLAFATSEGPAQAATVGGPPVALQIAGVPTTSVAGTPMTVSVTVVNSSGGTVRGFVGNVYVHSSDPKASLPSKLTFTAVNHGTRTFNATLFTAGKQSITVKNPRLRLKPVAFDVVTPGATAAITLLGTPPTAYPGMDASFNVTAVDTYGNRTPSFHAVETVASSDPNASFRSPVRFGRGYAYVGMTFNTPGTQTVTLANTATPSLDATFSFSVVAVVAPGQPTSITASAGDGTATVNFSAPTELGNPSLQGYTVTSTPATYTFNVAAPGPVTFPNLTDGTTYTFSVTAYSSLLTSSPATSDPVTPVGPPSTPSVQWATPHDGSVAVGFYSPSDAADNGGDPVTSFTVTSSPGNISVSASPSDAYAASPFGSPWGSITVPGLTDGTSYTFTVTSTSDFGTSAPSGTSAPVTPTGPPSAPTLGTVTPGNAQATVAFTPEATNGSNVTEYQVNYTDVTSGNTGTVYGLASPIDVLYLTNGDSYTFSVQAYSTDKGTSPPSATSSPVLVATAPTAPQLFQALTGPEQATLYFYESSTGGSPVTSYTATAEPGGITATGSGSPLTITGLSDGTDYTFSLVATNVLGTSGPSTTQTATTPSVPGAPVIDLVTSGIRSLVVTWEGSTSNGGDPIQGYTMTATPVAPFTAVDPPTVSRAGCCEPQTLAGLAPGQAYDVALTATNDVGLSPAATFGPIDPSGFAPDAPGPGTATVGDGQVSLPFTPPANTGDAPVSAYTVTAVPQAPVTAPSSAPVRASCSTSPDTCNGDVVTVNGLTNGQTYLLSLTASNTYGTSPDSYGQVATPFAVPSPPTNLTATSNEDGSSTLSFTPGDPGTYPLQGFNVYANGNLVTSGTTSPIVIYRLVNGQPYTFTMTEWSEFGTSVLSDPSNVAVPVGAPSQPTSASAEAANGSALVTFGTPADDGGSAITGYTVTASPGGATVTGATSPINVTGLTNGVPYTFTVNATNGVHTSAASGPTGSVTPTGPPDAPAIGSATAGIHDATVAFSPGSDGGLPVSTYTVTASPGGVTAQGTTSPITVTGLADGGTYTFSVTATNSDGTSLSSDVSNSVTLPTGPAAPAGVSAAPADGSAAVSFSAPSDGGSPVTSYTVTASPGGATATGTASPISVTGLTDGVAYTFTVTASNAVGPSVPSSPSTAVTPVGVPGSPTIGSATAGESSASVIFSAPASDGGLAITSYTVTASPGGATATGTASPINVNGLTDGMAYTFTVTAANSAGPSNPSAASNAVTPEPVQLITNGGFEHGLTGWNVQGPGVGTTVQPVHSGNSALRMTAGQALGVAQVSQSFVVPTTGTTTLSFWYQTSDTAYPNPPNYDGFIAQIVDPRTGQAATPLDTQNSVGTWTQVVFQVPAAMAGDNVTLYFLNAPQYDDTQMWVDDVSVIN
jgi:hypothetical protein